MKLHVHTLIAAALAIAATAPAIADGPLDITQKGRRFTPGTTDIAAGQTLSINNRDEFIHQIYVEKIGFNSPEQKPGQNVQVKFTDKGTFEIRCHIHPKMKLVVRVN